MVGQVGPSSNAREILGHQAVCFGDSKGPGKSATKPLQCDLILDPIHIVYGWKNGDKDLGCKPRPISEPRRPSSSSSVDCEGHTCAPWARRALHHPNPETLSVFWFVYNYIGIKLAVFLTSWLVSSNFKPKVKPQESQLSHEPGTTRLELVLVASYRFISFRHKLCTPPPRQAAPDLDRPVFSRLLPPPANVPGRLKICLLNFDLEANKQPIMNQSWISQNAPKNTMNHQKTISYYESFCYDGSGVKMF